MSGERYYACLVILRVWLCESTVLVYYSTIVCAYSMYVTQYVCMLYLYLLLLWRVCVLVNHSLFLASEIRFSGGCTSSYFTFFD